MKNDFMSNTKEYKKPQNCIFRYSDEKGKQNCCRLKPVYDPDTSKYLGCLYCESISEKECQKSRNEKKHFEKLHAEAEISRPLGIDEVAFAFVAALRVSSWENLGEEFGGYKQGRLLAYILSVLNEKIEESTAATIRVDVPLYEQCPTVPLKEKVYEKCPLKDSEFYGKTVKELMNDLAEKIEHSCDYLNKNKNIKESEEKYCMYCKEKDGTINHDVFIQISDEELGVGWVCKKCFLESEEEKDELMYTQQQNIINKNNVLNRIKEITKEPFEIDGNPAFLQVKAQNRFRDILTLVKKGLEEE